MIADCRISHLFDAACGAFNPDCRWGDEQLSILAEWVAGELSTLKAKQSSKDMRKSRKEDAVSSEGQESESRVPQLLVILGLAMVACFALTVNQEGEDTVPSEMRSTTDPYAGEVEDGRSFGEVLATEQTRSPDTSTQLVNRFNRLLDGIADQCSQSREWVSDRVITGHQTLTDRGGEASLLDVAEGWYDAVQGPASSDCVSTLSALLATLETEG